MTEQTEHTGGWPQNVEAMREMCLIFHGDSRKAVVELRVAGRIRVGHMKEVTFDEGSYEMMRKWMFHVKKIN